MDIFRAKIRAHRIVGSLFLLTKGTRKLSQFLSKNQLLRRVIENFVELEHEYASSP